MIDFLTILAKALRVLSTRILTLMMSLLVMKGLLTDLMKKTVILTALAANILLLKRSAQMKVRHPIVGVNRISHLAEAAVMMWKWIRRWMTTVLLHRIGLTYLVILQTRQKLHQTQIRSTLLYRRKRQCPRCPRVPPCHASCRAGTPAAPSRCHTPSPSAPLHPNPNKRLTR